MLSRLSLPRWITCPKSKPDALFRLFCFPYAGGSASLFREWATLFPWQIEVCSIQLPGRESRLAEPAFTKVEALVPILAQAMSSLLNKPCVFFGHSLGAIISFELARYLLQTKDVCPLHLFVSAHGAPQLPRTDPPTYDLPLPEFLQKLRLLRGTPEDILRNAELMQLLLPALRADFQMAETYVYVPGKPLPCSLSAFGGLQDTNVSYNGLQAWQEQTSSTLTVRMFSGDHFFLHTDRAQVVQTIVDDLAKLL